MGGSKHELQFINQQTHYNTLEIWGGSKLLPSWISTASIITLWKYRRDQNKKLLSHLNEQIITLWKYGGDQNQHFQHDVFHKL